MDRDREPVFAELKEEDYLRLSEESMEQGMVMLDAYDFSLGLSEEEDLPGHYMVEYDLSTLDIPEEAYPYVRAARVLEDGRREIYAVDLNGSVASYQSKNNTFIEWVFILPLMSVGTQYYAMQQYYEDNLVNKTVYADTTDDNKLLVMWTKEDFEGRSDDHPESYVPLNQERLKLEQEFLETAKAAYPIELYGNSDDARSRTRVDQSKKRNEDIAKAVIGLIRLDKNYQSLKAKAMAAYPFPVRKALEDFDPILDYLTGPDQGVKAPSLRVELLFVKEGEGNTKKIADGATALISLGIATMYEGVSGDDTSRGETKVLTTLTHELFHACQYEYFTFFAVGSNENARGTHNLLLMESTAAVVENEAFVYFQKKGMTPGFENATIEEALDPGSGCLTTRALEHYFGVEIDERVPAAFKNDPGYQWADFIDFLNEKLGRKTMAQVFSNYRANKSFSATIRDAYGLSPSRFQGLLAEFLRGKPTETITAAVNGATFTMAKDISYSFGYDKTKNGGWDYHSDTNTYGGYLRVHRLQIPADKQEHAMILMPAVYEDGEGPQTGPGGADPIYEITPAAWKNRGGGSLTADCKVLDQEKGILYLPPDKMVSGSLAVIEQTAWSPNKVMRGFRAFLMFPPDAPKYELDESKQFVVLYLPEQHDYSLFKDESLTQYFSERGYQFEALRSDGSKFELYTPLSEFKGEKPAVRVPVKDLYKNASPEDAEIQFHMTVAEAFKVGETLYIGPKSEEAQDDLKVIFGTWSLNSVLRGYSSSLDGLVGMMGSAANQMQGSGASQDALNSMNQYVQEYGKTQDQIVQEGKKGQEGRMIIRPMDGSEDEYEAVVEIAGSCTIYNGSYDPGDGKLYLTQTDTTFQGSDEIVYDFEDYGLLSSLTLKVQEEGSRLTCKGDMIMNSKIAAYSSDITGAKESNNYDQYDELAAKAINAP